MLASALHLICKRLLTQNQYFASFCRRKNGFFLPEDVSQYKETTLILRNVYLDTHIPSLVMPYPEARTDSPAKSLFISSPHGRNAGLISSVNVTNNNFDYSIYKFLTYNKRQLEIINLPE